MSLLILDLLQLRSFVVLWKKKQSNIHNILLLRKSVRSLLTFRQIGKVFTSMKETLGNNFSLFSGDREAVIARQEFIQQLSLWDEEETTEEQSFRKVPLPGVWWKFSGWHFWQSIKISKVSLKIVIQTDFPANINSANILPKNTFKGVQEKLLNEYFMLLTLTDTKVYSFDHIIQMSWYSRCMFWKWQKPPSGIPRQLVVLVR